MESQHQAHAMATAVALTALFALPAIGPTAAADLGGRGSSSSLKDSPVESAPAYNWSGFYIGANIGGARQNGDAKTTGTAIFQSLNSAITPGSLDTSDSSVIGGAQVGYNFQAGSLVYGLELDFSWLDASGASSFTGSPVLGTQLTTTARTELDWLATLRGRLGVLATERTLIYVTGGLAVGDVKTSASVAGVQAPALSWEGSTSDTRAGFTIGGGAEFAITRSITLKAEYLYYDLGRQDTAALGNAAVRAIGALNGIDYTTRTSIDGSIVRGGLNFKF